jgi:hypothetical protein
VDDSLGTGWAVDHDFTTAYIKRLLIERRYIYEKLYNPGGSIILRASDIVDHDRPLGYSTEIGNNFHLDLIQLEQTLQSLIDEGVCSKKEVNAIITWVDGMSSQQAADYLQAKGGVSVRKLRERATKKLAKRLTNGNRG